MSLSEEEIERYARHIVLRGVGGPGQQKLKAARVLVVGAGGLGVLIFQGMHMLDTGYLLAGTLPVAVMAVAADHALGAAENSLRRSMGTENNATQI